MSMLFCRDCEKEFSEDEAIRKYDRGEAWGAPYTEEYLCCPHCGSDDITDKYINCDRCGNACEFFYETDDGEYICEDCYKLEET